MLKLVANLEQPPLAAVAAVELCSVAYPLPIDWVNSPSGIVIDVLVVPMPSADLLRCIARTAIKQQLYGNNVVQRTQVDAWLTYSQSFGVNVAANLNQLETHLGANTYLVSNRVTIADLAVFETIYQAQQVLGRLDTDDLTLPACVQRWYDLIAGLPAMKLALRHVKAPVNRAPRAAAAKKTKSAPKNESSSGKANAGNAGERKQEGKFIDLPGAELGKVVVRFPPEASGYLHIGHAKAALLNQYYAKAYAGKLVMRFDDTNPAKETVEFEQVILQDLKLLEIKPDVFTHTSDYFDLMLAYCEQLIRSGKAYADDTPAEQMKAERDEHKESAHRNNDVVTNLAMWEEMIAGTKASERCCIRAKIDMQSLNGCMRDPTIYRRKNEPHPKTGLRYKVYPTYDFACPIVDAIEDVTHTLRTTEYLDRDDQFYWFIEALELRKPHIWSFSRLNMTNTVLSKRKLTWFVNSGLVDGWDDARFPTVRGILRRGMTVKGLTEFIIAQGSSKSVVFMEWDKIWTFNKKVIDPIAPRYTALEARPQTAVRVHVAGQAVVTTVEVALHPKNTEVGVKRQHIGPRLLIDRADAELLRVGEYATFINWGNMLVRAVRKDESGQISDIDVDLRLDNTDFKKTLKLTWLCDAPEAAVTPLQCVYFEHIISKPVLAKTDEFMDYVAKDTRVEVPMTGEPELRRCKEGDIIQLTRRGFFRVDRAYQAESEYTGVASPVVLFAIPDGHAKALATSGQPVALKATPAPAAADAATPTPTNSNDLNAKITAQGELVRDLKANKAAKPDIEAAVKTLLSLKADYKQATGNDWKPAPAGTAAPVTPAASASPATGAAAINDRIAAQGDLVRDLKAKKAAKPEVEAAVKALLSLKAEYKQATGADWKPGCVPATDAAAPTVAAAIPAGGQAADINAKISAQGDLVRDLKAKKAAKPEVEAAVKALLSLKAEYKQATGAEWKPAPAAAVAAPAVASAGPSAEINAKISAQGDLVRDLKAKKAAKPEVEAAVKALLSLKAEYKQATGAEWKPAPAATVAASAVAAAGPSAAINAKITAQGDLVRDLKAKKAAKPEVEAAVKTLLSLKAEYKTTTGSDWKPTTTTTSPTPAVATATAAAPKSSSPSADINAKITAQGDLVRDLKAKKAAKPEVEAAVKTLLSLKAEYKQATGAEWKPTATVPAAVTAAAAVVSVPAVAASASPADTLNAKITVQGDLVRDLKAKKAAKPEVEAAVKALLALKAEYKQATGTDWKPAAAAAPTTKPVPAAAAVAAVAATATMPVVGSAADIHAKIARQGDAVRDLKAQKAAKGDIDAAVKSLLALKVVYKSAAGQEWKPGCVPPGVAAQPTASAAQPTASAAQPTASAAQPPASAVEDPAVAAAISKVNAQSNAVRDLKAGGSASPADVKAAVDALLTLKAAYKTLTGKDFPVAGRGGGNAPAKSSGEPKPKAAPKAKPAPKAKDDAAGDSAVKKQTRLGLEALKADNLPEWYSQVITKSEMIEYYDVSGCYILRPNAIAVWRTIQNFFQDEITKLGVKECYFPMFVSKAALEKEKAHIADFSPEVAWVTRSGDSDLAEPIAIRPTSETIMYPAFAKWIQSYRDLPLKLNQWSNVVRWEFKHPQPFLRTREFLWQEGHTAFAEVAEAEAEVMDILGLYARVYEELLAIPVRRGRKSEKEKFAGGSYTTTVEAFVSASGRSIQGATSHHLGQNFSKMFDIVYEDPATQEKKFVYQNSWGITTRTIGVMIMVHGDDKGLVMPPRVAPTQAVVVPCGVTVTSTEAERAALQASCDELVAALRAAGVRVEGDFRDNYSPGWKFNHWELKGTPIRVELGPKDMRAEQLVLVRRDTGEKLTVRRAEAGAVVAATLEAIQANMFARAQKDFVEHMVQTKSWPEFCANLEKKNLLCSPFCGGIECEDQIKEDSAITEATEPGAMLTGAKSLCIPFEQPTAILATDACINPKCSAKPKHWCYFGRSY